jgi:hypothetical protein
MKLSIAEFCDCGALQRTANGAAVINLYYFVDVAVSGDPCNCCGCTLAFHYTRQLEVMMIDH